MRGITTKKTKELDQQILNLYKSGISGQNIAGIVHVSTRYVAEIINKSGLRGCVWTRGLDENKIIEHYQKTLNIAETAKYYNTTEGIIKGVLNRHKILVEHLEYNKNIFQKIDTEEKAYWLGFLYADGYVQHSNNKYSIELSLKDSDKAHVEKFAEFIGLPTINVKIKSNGAYKQARLTISCKQMVEDLEKAGCVNNKSFTVQFPDEKILPKPLRCHFIRGYFDGDGCIMYQENKLTNNLKTSIVGTEQFLNTIKSELGINKSLIPRKCKNNQTIYYLNFRILHSIKLCLYMYKNCSIYLDRKYSKWNKYCRSNKKLLEALVDKFGEDWNVNPEVIHYVNYNVHRNA